MGMKSAFDLMQEFYLSRYYEPKPERPADNVQAAIEFSLDQYAVPDMVEALTFIRDTKWNTMTEGCDLACEAQNKARAILSKLEAK